MRSPFALVHKDLRVTLRSPLFAILSVLVPVAFTMLYAIVIHVSTTSSIAVAVADDSPEARRFVEVMQNLHNDDGRYYEIRTTDPVEASRMYAQGEVGALLTIPDGFGSAVRAGDHVSLVLDVVNINADGVKNQQLRLEYAVREFAHRSPSEPASLVVVEDKVLDRDIPVTVYLGTALMVLTALYAGIVNAGTLVAREWEERTAKGLLLSPAGGSALIFGKWLSTAAVSIVTVAAGILGIASILDYPVSQIGPHAMAVLAVVWAYGAALGTLLGVALRRSLPLIPVAVIIAVGHFLVCGYESYIRGFAHGGAVEILWRATAWIPLSALVDSFRFEVSSLAQPPGVGSAFVWSALLAVCLTALALLRLNRAIKFTQGQ
ncbi:MAG TPA: ABC transporter permease [Jiangellales bacterium]|nr:ABC transporter permease [Jiangellales bacterium]